MSRSKGVNTASKLCNELLVPPGFTEVYKYRTAILFKTKYYIAGKKRPAWDYKGRLEDMEAFLLKSNSCMEDMTKTIGDNQGRIGYLESLNKQLEGTVQVKNQQSEQVRSVSIAIPWSGRGSRSLPIPHSRFFCTTIPLPKLLSSLSPVPFSFPIPPTVPRVWRIKLPEKRSNPVSRQEILRFPESRTIFRSQGYKTITETSGRKVIPGSWGKTHCLRLFILISQLKNETNYKVSFIHHHYLLCMNGTWISRIFKVMCERV